MRADEPLGAHLAWEGNVEDMTVLEAVEALSWRGERSNIGTTGGADFMRCNGAPQLADGDEEDTVERGGDTEADHAEQ